MDSSTGYCCCSAGITQADKHETTFLTLNLKQLYNTLSFISIFCLWITKKGFKNQNYFAFLNILLRNIEDCAPSYQTIHRTLQPSEWHASVCTFQKRSSLHKDHCYQINFKLISISITFLKFFTRDQPLWSLEIWKFVLQFRFLHPH